MGRPQLKGSHLQSEGTVDREITPPKGTQPRGDGPVRAFIEALHRNLHNNHDEPCPSMYGATVLIYAGSACGPPAPAPRARPSPGRLGFPPLVDVPVPQNLRTSADPQGVVRSKEQGVSVGGIPGQTVVTPRTSPERVSTSGEGADHSRPAPRGSAPPVRDAGPLVGSSTASCVTVPPDPAT